MSVLINFAAALISDDFLSASVIPCILFEKSSIIADAVLFNVIFVSKNVPISVYISFGEFSNPTPFDFDIKYEKVNSNREIRLDRGTSFDDFGYSVAI